MNQSYAHDCTLRYAHARVMCSERNCTKTMHVCYFRVFWVSSIQIGCSPGAAACAKCTRSVWILVWFDSCKYSWHLLLPQMKYNQGNLWSFHTRRCSVWVNRRQQSDAACVLHTLPISRRWGKRSSFCTFCWSSWQLWLKYFKLNYLSLNYNSMTLKC